MGKQAVIIAKYCSPTTWKVTVPIDDPSLTWEYARREIIRSMYPDSTTDCDDTSLLDSTFFKGEFICPLARLSDVGLSPTEDNEVSITYQLGVGPAPPPTLLRSIKYQPCGISADIRLAPKCPRTRHSNRNNEALCQWCGRAMYQTVLVKNRSFLPADGTSEIHFKFNRFSYSPGQKDLFTVRISEMGHCIRVRQKDNLTAPDIQGTIEEVFAWTRVKHPFAIWKTSEPLEPGVYVVELSENNYPIDGNPPRTLGLVRWEFRIK